MAGAGSGKTTLMAARVVHLVLTGQVRPDEVLGLTFTTKAAAELGQRIRASLETLGVELDGEPTMKPILGLYGPKTMPLRVTPA